MGWAGGTYIFDEVMDAVLEHVPTEASRRAIARRTAEALWQGDWDTEEESTYFSDYLEPLMLEKGYISPDDL